MQMKNSNPFADMNPVQRICRIIALDLEEFLRIEKERGISRDSWTAGEIIASYEYLRERMQQLRFTKKELKQYGCNYSELRRLYFSVA